MYPQHNVKPRVSLTVSCGCQSASEIPTTSFATCRTHSRKRKEGVMQSDNRIIVLKFGSSVLGSENDLPTAVHEIYRWWRDGYQVVAVVSAFGNTTDELTQRALSVCEQPDDTRVAALLEPGEATASVWLGLALNRAGVPASVLDAEQAGLATDGAVLDA